MIVHPIKKCLIVCCCLLLTVIGLTQSTLLKNKETISEKKTSTTTFQSPYQLDFKKDASIFGAALGIQITSLIIANKVEPLTVAEIELLKPAQIKGFGFDRKTVRHFSAKAHSTSDIFLYGSMIFPLILMADKNIRKDFLKIGTLASEAFLLNAGLTTLLKGTVKRTRPFAYNPLVPIEDKMTKSTRMSFFSGHTSAVSVLSFFSAKVFADYHPESKWKPVVWAAAAIIPATTGYLRYRAGKHFPTDVIVGYGVGAAIGVLIPYMHRSNKERKFKVSLMTSSDAVGLTLRGML